MSPLTGVLTEAWYLYRRFAGHFLLIAFVIYLITGVQDVRDGRVDLDLGETVRAAGPYILPVIGASILAGIGVTIGFFLLIVPGFILLTYWCLIVPFIVLGGAGVFQSFGHSMRT